MAISASQVNELRKRTGVGLMACKKALDETNGDMEESIKILRKRGEARVVEKASREATEGLIRIYKNDKKAALAHFSCETDFVARNEELIKIAEEFAERALNEGADAVHASADGPVSDLVGKLGENIKLEGIKVAEGENLGTYVHSNNKIGVIMVFDGGDKELATDIAMHVAAMDPYVIHPEEISNELVEQEKEIWIEQLKKEGKPENIIENILKGKERKFREESALIKQPFVKDPSKKIEDILGDVKVLDMIRVQV